MRREPCGSVLRSPFLRSPVSLFSYSPNAGGRAGSAAVSHGAPTRPRVVTICAYRVRLEPEATPAGTPAQQAAEQAAQAARAAHATHAAITHAAAEDAAEQSAQAAAHHAAA